MSARARLFLIGTLVLVGCPEPRSKQAFGACERAYEKCQLAEGLLGVCDVVECTQGQVPPCLVCRSQH